jgi:hypothetical protein
MEIKNWYFVCAIIITAATTNTVRIQGSSHGTTTTAAATIMTTFLVSIHHQSMIYGKDDNDHNIKYILFDGSMFEIRP